MSSISDESPLNWPTDARARCSNQNQSSAARPSGFLGCIHFKYFDRDLAQLLPTLAARNGIISPSGALA